MKSIVEHLNEASQKDWKQYTFKWLMVADYDDPECDKFVDAKKAATTIKAASDDEAIDKAYRLLNKYKIKDVVAVNIYGDDEEDPIDTLIHDKWEPRN